MKLTRLAAVSAVALIAIAGAAIGAGYFPGWPVVGAGSYCNGYATGTTGQVCTSTVPAGPASMSGNELFPADISGATAQPYTVMVPAIALGGGTNQFPIPTGTSYTYGTSPNVGSVVFVAPASSPITRVNISMPPAAINGQRFRVSANANISNLVMSAATGQSLSNAPVSLLVQTIPLSWSTGATSGYYTIAPAGFEFIYSTAFASWYRIQ